MHRRIGGAALDLALVLVLAEAVVAIVALAAGTDWKWGRYLSLVVTGLVITVVQAGAASFVRREARPSASARSAKEEETAAAIRSGSIPPGADPEVWPARIRRHVQSGTEVLALVLVGHAVAAALTAVVAARDGDPVLWLMAAATVLLPLPLVRLGARKRRRARLLLAGLEAGSPSARDDVVR